MANTESPIEQATEMAREAQAEMPGVRARYAPAAQEGLVLFENIPAPVWIAFSLGSILLSMGLFFSGRRWAAMFVGLWPPTIVNLGLFARLLKPSSE
jgi:hypothetical protein